MSKIFDLIEHAHKLHEELFSLQQESPYTSGNHVFSITVGMTGHDSDAVNFHVQIGRFREILKGCLNTVSDPKKIYVSHSTSPQYHVTVEVPDYHKVTITAIVESLDELYDVIDPEVLEVAARHEA